jgi:hypothetical protein
MQCIWCAAAIRPAHTHVCKSASRPICTLNHSRPARVAAPSPKSQLQPFERRAVSRDAEAGVLITGIPGASSIPGVFSGRGRKQHSVRLVAPAHAPCQGAFLAAMLPRTATRIRKDPGWRRGRGIHRTVVLLSGSCHHRCAAYQLSMSLRT